MISPAALVAAAPCPLNAYLVVLLGAAVRGRRRRPPRPVTDARMRFAIVVPARDEEASIGTALASLRALEYPPDLVEIVVVADNCADRTADVAAACGATVWARNGGGGAVRHGGKGLQTA